ncbi:MAG: hypothetical protein AB7O26_02735 [Planctomycetaceae bacterium]
MTLAIRQAIFQRWNDSGLDAAIAPLFAGDRSAASASPTLPRAQYTLPAASERTRSRISRELFQDLRFMIWGADDRAVQLFLDLAEGAFVNSESDESNPLAIPEEDGKILSVDFAGESVIQESTAIFQGILQLRIQWCRPIEN